MLPDDLVERAISGDRRALSRLATKVENANDRDLIDRLYQIEENAHIIGMTGPPGSGKSTLTSSIATMAIEGGNSVAVIAVDPSSPATGGATLGDRVRMSSVATHPSFFIRSMASRGRRDGLSPSIAPMIQLFDVAGFDLVLVETVGAGQDQYEIASLVDTLILAEAPGAGDSVQMLKAGVMELADIYVVTKSDLDGSKALARDMRATLGLGIIPDGVWRPPVQLCSSETGEGISDLMDAIGEHRAFLVGTAEQIERRNRRAYSEIRQEAHWIAESALKSEVNIHELTRLVTSREMTPREAAYRIIGNVDPELVDH